MNIINFVLCGNIGVKSAGSAEPVLLVLTDIQTDTDQQYTQTHISDMYYGHIHTSLISQGILSHVGITTVSGCVVL